jgi:hypothetical protein
MRERTARQKGRKKERKKMKDMKKERRRGIERKRGGRLTFISNETGTAAVVFVTLKYVWMTLYRLMPSITAIRFGW